MILGKRGAKASVLLCLVILVVYLVKVAKVFTTYPDRYLQSQQFKETEFANPTAIASPDLLPILSKYWNEESIDNIPDAVIPITSLTSSEIQALPDDQLSVIRFGHSTTLIKIGNQLWLIDPVFSERTSPFSFIGPRRFHQPPISIQNLPELAGVIISHDHYDHLDSASITQLRNKVRAFIVPLGLAAKLEGWGVSNNKITELDWWESIKFEGLEIVATPAQHFSGRGLFDRNSTLWSSWVIKSDQHRVFYSGDSGYFDGFKDIGQRYGPFDLALLEVGAYDKLWPAVHMFPAQAVQANQDLTSRRMIPVHNGTFDLAFHAWYEPLDEVSKHAKAVGTTLLTPSTGQILTLSNGLDTVDATTQWWRQAN